MPPKKQLSKERRSKKSYPTQPKKGWLREEVEIEKEKEKDDHGGSSAHTMPIDDKDQRAIFAQQILARSPKDIFKEYRTKELAKVKPDNYTYLTCQRFDNKNRYHDIFCLDETRVKLKDRDASNDYIHASWLTMPNGRRYISTQGPLEETTEEFWHMIVTEGSSIIIMLCALSEGREEKCHRYFPKPSKGNQLKFGDYRVTYACEMKSDQKEKSVYQYKVTGGKLSDAFTVTHYQIHSWKDHSIPSNLTPIIKLHKQVIKDAGDKPITVHCSAGIGRTSTFIGIDYADQCIRTNPNFTMPQLLKDLRKQRLHAVQGGGQYLFIHAALLELWLHDGLLKREHCEAFFTSYRKVCAQLDKKADGVAKE